MGVLIKKLLVFDIDKNNGKPTPWVNYSFILLNVLVFCFLQQFGTNSNFTYSFANVPAEILSGNDFVTDPLVITSEEPSGINHIAQMPALAATPIPVWLTLVTSFFMHNGWSLLIANMLLLFLLGNKLETWLGHTRYFLFYIFGGILAGICYAAAVYFLDENMLLPWVGASGALSAVIGGYIISSSEQRVSLFSSNVRVPLFIIMMVWLAVQVINGSGLPGGVDISGAAFAPQVVGFIAGLFLIKVFFLKKSRAYKYLFQAHHSTSKATS
ncbi:MAG: rhomboid family intramembrane serine protease [Ferruginibacter sp.]